MKSYIAGRLRQRRFANEDSGDVGSGCDFCGDAPHWQTGSQGIRPSYPPKSLVASSVADRQLEVACGFANTPAQYPVVQRAMRELVTDGPMPGFQLDADSKTLLNFIGDLSRAN